VQSGHDDDANDGGAAMTRLWKVPGTIAEYTVGTLIVLYQLSVLDRQRRTIDREQSAIGTSRPSHHPHTHRSPESARPSHSPSAN
jgi:hypothetical protein